MNTEARNKRFELRLTTQEFEDLINLEKQLGLPRADLIRSRVFKNSNTVLVNAHQLLGLLDILGAEMGKVGNNINQMARLANTLEKRGLLTPSVVLDFNALFVQHIQGQNELNKAIRHLLRLLSHR